VSWVPEGGKQSRKAIEDMASNIQRDHKTTNLTWRGAKTVASDTYDGEKSLYSVPTGMRGSKELVYIFLFCLLLEIFISSSCLIMCREENYSVWSLAAV